MHSSLIGKIEKAKRYQQEPGRIHFQTAQVEFHGEHDNYVVELKNGLWHCTCHTFQIGLEDCAHVMAMQRILDPMLDEEARSAHPALVS